MSKVGIHIGTKLTPKASSQDRFLMELYNHSTLNIFERPQRDSGFVVYNKANFLGQEFFSVKSSCGIKFEITEVNLRNLFTVIKLGYKASNTRKPKGG